MYVLQFYRDISKNDYLGLLLLFSNRLWPNIWTLSAAAQPPMGTAGPCRCASGSCRLCSLPFRFKTLQRCSAETKTSGLQDSYSHSLSPPYCPITRYKAQKTRTTPMCPFLSLCWPPAGSVVETGLHPSSGGFPGSTTASKLRGRGKTLEHGGPARWGRSSGCPLVPQLLGLFEFTIQYVPPMTVLTEHLLCSL